MKKEHDLAKWLAGELHGSDLHDFEQSTEFAIYQKIKDHTEGLQAPGFDSEKMYQNVISHKKKKPVFQLKWLTPVAAILVLALGFLFISKPYFGTMEVAAAGETQFFALPDHSQIVLNADSDLHYSKWNWDDTPQVTLSGEAYFKVAKGSTFDVKTELGIVTVVGTQFNVKARKQRFEVECYEGKVKVSFKGKHLFLTHGQGVVVVDGMETPMQTTDTQPAWTLNEIRFYNNSLQEVLTELEQQYDIAIDGKAVTFDRQFTGRLPKDNLDTALQIISKTYRFNFKKPYNKKIILTPNVETP